MEKLLNLLSPLKWYLLAALMTATALMTWKVLDWREDAGKLASCQDSATKLKETNDGLQKSRDDTASKLRSYKLRQQNCTVLLADSEQAGARPAGGNAPIVATTDDLYDYAAVCRNYWLERIALEKILND